MRGDEMEVALDLWAKWQERWGKEVTRYVRLPYKRTWLEFTDSKNERHCFTWALCESYDELKSLLELPADADTLWNNRRFESDRLYLAATANVTLGKNGNGAFIIHPEAADKEDCFTIAPMGGDSPVLAEYCLYALCMFVTLLNSPTIANQSSIARKRRKREAQARASFTQVRLCVGPQRALDYKRNPGKYADQPAFRVGGHYKGQWYKDHAGDWQVKEIWVDDYVKGDPSKGTKDPRYKL